MGRPRSNKLVLGTKHPTLMPFTSVEDLNRYKAYMLGLPVKQLRHGVPWGYTSVEGSRILEPVDHAYKALVKAIYLLEECTPEDVAEWLSEETGIPLSKNGLIKIVNNRRPDPRAALPREVREEIFNEGYKDYIESIEIIKG